MVVTGDHVLGAKVGEGQQVRTRDLLDVALVALGHAMGVRESGQEQVEQYACESVQQRPGAWQHGCPPPAGEGMRHESLPMKFAG